MHKINLGVLAFSLLLAFQTAAEERRELRVGVAGHAFDHLGNIGEQAEAAAASGSTIIYGTGFGGIGYEGLRSPTEMEKTRQATSEYNRLAKKKGIQLVIGYVCATSIVKLETFDKNWSKELRAQFSSPPSQWLQKDQNGNPLPSWYGGDYRPACMNNPDWLAYEKFIVRQQIESGHDGIFFDNPTVHPQGCYCEHCMKKFARFLTDEGAKLDLPSTNSLSFLRQLAVNRPKDFMRFRSITARDFMAEIRRFARTLKRDALITCNNSLNSPGVFFSQCRDYGYNIYEMSKAEDLVVVEDMVNQPRILADGNTVEYGYVYNLLQAISHGKPVVAVAIADGDYHTPPNLVRLAMAEAAAHNASYLSWPTWPENMRQRMISSIRPQADFLRQNSKILNGTTKRTDALLFLPFRRWVETADCPNLKIAQALNRANVQFEVVCEEDLAKKLKSKSALTLIVEASSVLFAPEKLLIEKYTAAGGKVISADKPDWLGNLQNTLSTRSVVAENSPTVRVIAHDQLKKTIVHLINLNVQRLSSFEDKVTPASDVKLTIRVPLKRVRSVEALTADTESSHGKLTFSAKPEKSETIVEVTIPRVTLSTILRIE